jgi:hypothetical protein
MDGPRIIYTNLTLPKKNAKSFFFKRMIEALFRNSFGDRLDNYLMNLTTKRWAEKTAKNKLNDRGIVLSLDTSRHYAKQNPKYFQMGIVEEYENKVSELFRKYDESTTAVLSEKAV